jgi:proteasome beta subunit
MDFATIGSGSPFAESTLRLGFRGDLDLEGALDLGALALYEAGDNDPSTAGPDFVRSLFPMMVMIDAEGFQELPGDAVASRFGVINDRRTQSGGVAGGTLR